MPTTPVKAGLLPRHVLGELTPNAKLSPKKSRKASATEWAPVQQEQKHAVNCITAANEPAPPSSKAVFSPSLHGKKRTFAEFNDAPMAHAEQTTSRHEQAPHTALKRGTVVTPQIRTFQVLNDTTPTAGIVDFKDSLDASQASFTSLVDYQPADTANINAPAVSTPPTSTGDANVLDLRSQVETLRLRLRVAMFKVQTNQTHLPMSQLEIAPGTINTSRPVNTMTRSRSTSIVVPTCQTLQPSPPPAIILSPTKSSPESHPHNRPVPKLLPAPILRPTTYSTRFIYAPPNASMEQPCLPSSPPDSDLKETPKTPPNRSAGLRTPVRSSSRKSKLELSSPPDTVEQDEGRLIQGDGRLSSIVKGRAAARGLVELMHSA